MSAGESHSSCGRERQEGSATIGTGAASKPPSSGRRNVADAAAPAREATSAAGVGGPAPCEQSPALPPGTPAEIGSYRIVGVLGEGGMGTVYKAVHTKLKTLRALKVLPLDKAANPTLVRRFEKEAAAAAALEHENIVAIHEMGQWSGTYFLALEFVDGCDLHDLIAKRGRIPVRRSIEIMKQALTALDHASRRGFVHRDIKPSNFLIRRDGVVKLADLGLARHADDDSEQSRVTRDGTTVGTVDYIAPEQARSSRLADIRSDIYSLGCTWYHMLTGQPPFAEGDLAHKLYEHAKTPPPDPRRLNPDIPEAVVAVLNRMLAKDPADRYQTPAELLDELETLNLSRAPASRDAIKSLAIEAAPPPVRREPRPAPAASTEPVKGAAMPRLRRGFGISGTALFYGAIAAGAVGVLVLAAALSGVFSGGGSGEGQGGLAGIRPIDAFLDGSGRPRNTGSHARVPGESGSDSGAGRQQTPTGQEAGNTGDPHQAVAAAGNTQQSSRPTPRRLSPAEAARIRAEFGGTLAAPLVDSTGLTELRVVRVPAAPEDGVFTSLQAALDAVPPQGAVITIADNGPLLVPAARWEARPPEGVAGEAPAPRIVLRAAEGYRPLLVLGRGADEMPAPLPAAGEWAAVLDFGSCRLRIEGLHFVADAGSLPGAGTLSLIAAAGPAVEVIDSTFTLYGARSGRTAAVTLADGQRRDAGAAGPGAADADAGGLQVLVENCAVRGEAISGFSGVVAAGELVFRNTLFAASRGPLFELSGAGSQGTGANAAAPRQAEADGDTQRTVRIIESTWISGDDAIVLEGAGPDRTPATGFYVLDSVLALAENDGEAALAAREWPHDAETGRSLRLAWNTQGLLVPGPDGRSLAAETILFADASAFSARALAPRAVHLVRPLDGGEPGVDTRLLASPPAEWFQRALAGYRRLAIPPELERQEGRSGESLRVDAAQLNRQLANRNVAGVEVVVLGSGVVAIDPIRLSGSLRLRFETQGEEPLVLAPRAGTRAEALIEVTGGDLEISGGRFETGRQQQGSVRWLVRVTDGQVLLRDCEFRGPVAAASGAAGGDFRGVFCWERARRDLAARPNAAEAAEAFEHVAVIDGCYLQGMGELLWISAPRRALFLRDTVAVATGDLLHLDLEGANGDLAALVDLAHNTLAVHGAFVTVAGGADEPQPQTPVRLFAAYNVLCDPEELPGTARRPTLLRCEAPLLALGRIHWQGGRNLFADLEAYLETVDVGAIGLSASEVPPGVRGLAAATLAEWAGFWPQGEAQPLQGDALRFAERLPSLTELGRRSFLLDPASAAATAGPEGWPLGAIVERTQREPIRVGPRL